LSLSLAMIRPTKQERSDVQGLKSIAVFGIMLFGLAPRWFVNGFLGVDLYFVLSGYHTAAILWREPMLNRSVIARFYIIRFKRIIPLYVIMLLILSIIVPVCFPPADLPSFITDLKWALSLMTNLPHVLNGYDYWPDVDYWVLRHTWPICVELQYCLLASLIDIIARSLHHPLLRLPFFLALGGLSFVKQFFFTSSPFDLVFSRLWQFLIGRIAFKLEQWNAGIDGDTLMDEEDEEMDNIERGEPHKTRHRPSSHSLLQHCLSYCMIAFLFCVIFVTSWNPWLCRLLITLAAGSLLLMGRNSCNIILSNRILVYISDYSYMLYLVHWPVTVVYKYRHKQEELTAGGMLICLFTTLKLAMVLHHTLERFFIAASTTVAVGIVTIVYVIMSIIMLTGGMEQISEYVHR
ncbi:hypothetical protein PMAYCL1PPCAC_20241, partial [Pristionchus mayeri]